jgi:hypothetical protein
MAFPSNPGDRSPKGDHNRRLSLGIDPEEFAAQAGITYNELHRYESTPPDEVFDAEIAQRVGETLERLEATRTPVVDNGPSPAPVTAPANR